MLKFEILTVGELRKAIREVDVVYGQVRFGVSEQYIKIAKGQALELVCGYSPETTAEELDMYCGSLGHVEDGVLYIG